MTMANYQTKITLKGRGDVEFYLEFEQEMMLISDPDNADKCRLPFAALSDE